MDQTMIEMKVLTRGFRDPMAKFKIMVKRMVAMAQIILVMIWVVLQPAGEEYCCIQMVLLKPYLQPNMFGQHLGRFAACRGRVLLYSEGFVETVSTTIFFSSPFCQNLHLYHSLVHAPPQLLRF